MRRKVLIGAVLAEAVLCLMFGGFQDCFPEVFSTMIASPFEQLGALLRRWSLSGSVGNGAAWVLYVGICLIPCVIFLILRGRRRNVKADGCLPGLSVLLFAVLYFMINPSSFQENIPGTGKLLLGGTFYSVFFGYLVFRGLNKYRQADERELLGGLRTLLYLVILLLVYAAFGKCIGSLPAAMRSLGEVNQTGGGLDSIFPQSLDLSWSYVFLVLQSAVDALPYLLDICVTVQAIRLLDALLLDRYSDRAAEAAEKLAGLCVRTLALTVLSSVLLNLLQLVFHQKLLQINSVISIPLFSIVFVLGALLLARYVRENQQLKRDNDLFI